MRIHRRALEGLLAAACAVAAAAVAMSCSTEAYCFDCQAGLNGGAGRPVQQVGTDGGTIIQFGTGGSTGVGADGSASCNSTVDLTSDPKNCGACGNVCERTNALASCQSGKCQYSCAPNFWNLTSDLASPGGGCTYFCSKTGDAETCNGLDDDCNGLIDEALVGGKLVEGRVCNDVLNCGLFGRACLYTTAAGACKDGQCAEGACKTGFFPDPAKPLPNCDYACQPTYGGKEICDGRDNDCNGLIDDHPDVASDPLNCGACGKTCIGAFPNAQPLCQSGACALGTCYDGYFNDPSAQPQPNCLATCKSLCSFPFAAAICGANGACAMGACLGGHYDLNQDPKDGCEYACQPSGLTPPICNNLDNLCDGIVNEGIDLTSDPLNCGKCGVACDQYFPGSVTACVKSVCEWVSCKPGYVALNGSGKSGGCQYQCSQTNGGKEICDGIDNDCNGVIDDNLTDTGASCTTTKPGVCAPGTMACVSGALACASFKPPSQEICNGIDDDCNGIVDDGPDGTPKTLPGVGFACGQKQVGTCQFGTTTCGKPSGGGTGIVCAGEIDPVPETCNGLDDDCNGIVDDHLTDVWVTTPTACAQNPAPCKAGQYQCLNGAKSCIGATLPAEEVCDGTGPGTGSNPSCTGTPGQGCVWPTASPMRLDTANNPTQGVASNFQLTSASAKNEYFVAYSGVRPGNVVANVFVRVSVDAGSTWGANDLDLTAANTAEAEPSIFARPGRAYMVFSRFVNANGTGNRRIFSRRASATDAPAYSSWATGATVVSVRDQPSGGVDCFQPLGVVAKSDGTAVGSGDWLAAAWSEIGGTPTSIQRNVFLAYSKDGGATWSTAAPVNVGAGANSGQTPVLATNGNGVVFVAWRDERTAGLEQVYFARADLSAVTAPAAPTLTAATALQPTTGPSAGSATQVVMAASGSNVSVGWTDLRAKRSTIRVASSSDGGVTFTKVGGVGDGQIVDPDGQNNNATSASLAMSGNDVAVAWEDRRNGNPNIRVNVSGNAGVTWLNATPRVDTGTVSGSSTALAPFIAYGAPETTVGGTATRSLYATWQDFRFPSSAVLANVSLDGGITWAPNAALAYRMDVDTSPPTPAAGSAADSQAPLVLASPTSNQMSVVWVDFREATGMNGINGDIWTRLAK